MFLSCEFPWGLGLFGATLQTIFFLGCSGSGICFGGAFNGLFGTKEGSFILTWKLVGFSFFSFLGTIGN